MTIPHFPQRLDACLLDVEAGVAHLASDTTDGIVCGISDEWPYRLKDITAEATCAACRITEAM